MDQNLRREIILDNYNNPFHKEKVLDDNYIKVNTNNESCIDNIDMYLKIENDIIMDIKFDGEACAISTSATSIMLRRVIGKSIREVKELIRNYLNMINEQEYNSEMLQELNAYSEIYLQPNRKTCALLPANAILKVLEKYEG